MEEGKAAPSFRRRSRKQSNPRSTFYNPIKEAWEEEQRKLAEEQQKLAEEEEQRKLAEEPPPPMPPPPPPPISASPETPRWKYMKDYEKSFNDVVCGSRSSGNTGGESSSDATSLNIGIFLQVKFEPGESSHGDQRK